jgi:hypothetical protein
VVTSLASSPFSKEQRVAFASWLGKRSFEARRNRMGIERLREIARENGKKGGRPVLRRGTRP